MQEHVITITFALDRSPGQTETPLEDLQTLAGQANPRTTQIYDRRRRSVTRNIVERISV